MPINMEHEKKVSGHGFYVTSVFSPRDMLNNVVSEIENGYPLEGDRPQPYGRDARVLKVTVTVEEL